MPEMTTRNADRPKRSSGGKREKILGPVLVSGNRLAVHFGVVRQHVDQLAAQGVIERRADALFDQDQSRLRYFSHLRSEHRRSPRTAVDAEHVKAKTEMLQLKLAEKRGELVRQSDVDALIDELVGVTLTAMSSMPARCAPGGDLATRRCIERVIFEVRTEIANIAQRKATRRRSRRSANRADGATTQGARFRVLERKFKQGLPVIVGNDYPPAAGGRLVD